MVDPITPDDLAEAVERARFSLLRQGAWDELREGERQTRVGILRSALDSSGMTARLHEIEATALRSDQMADLLECRDEDFRRRLAQDDAEIVRLSDRIADLTEQLAIVTAEREDALARGSADARTLADVRDVLDGRSSAEIPTQSAPTTQTPSTPAPSNHQQRRTPRPRLSVATAR